MSSAASSGPGWALTTYSSSGWVASQPRAEPEPPQETPTFSECVIGYRTWTIDPFLRLWPMSGYGDRPWTPGVNVATCGRGNVPHYATLMGAPRAPAEHTSPHAQCDCGLYSRRRLKQTVVEMSSLHFEKLRFPVVAGAVAVWGDLRVHRDGFRASHAAIVALAETPGMPIEVRDLVRRVAVEYNVPFVAIDQLEAEASRHGSPLPDDVGPKAIAHSNAMVSPGALYSVPSATLWQPMTFSTTPPPRLPPSTRAAIGMGLAVVSATLAWNFGEMAILGHHWWVTANSFVIDCAIGWNAGKWLPRLTGFRARGPHHES
jgi:hypothetical protein